MRDASNIIGYGSLIVNQNRGGFNRANTGIRTGFAKSGYNKVKSIANMNLRLPFSNRNKNISTRPKYANTFEDSMRSVTGRPPAATEMPLAPTSYKVPPKDVLRNMSEAERNQLRAQNSMRPDMYAKGGLVGGTRLKRFAEGGAVGDTMTGMSGGFNVEALMSVANTFAAFTESMSRISESLNGITMQHQVTIDGQLNLNGINSVEIAEVIKNQVGTFIANEVSRVMQSERMKP